MCGPSFEFEALLHSTVVISALHTPSARYVVHPLYLHTINTRQPTMAVLHLTTGNVPFLQIDMQVRTRVSCATCATCIMSCVPRVPHVCAGALLPGAAPHQHAAQLRGHADLAGRGRGLASLAAGDRYYIYIFTSRLSTHQIYPS